MVFIKLQSYLEYDEDRKFYLEWELDNAYIIKIVFESPKGTETGLDFM